MFEDCPYDFSVDHDDEDDEDWIDEDETSSDDDDDDENDEDEDDDEISTTGYCSSNDNKNAFLPLFENKRVFNSYNKEKHVQVIEYDREHLPKALMIEFIINFVFPSKAFGVELDPLRSWNYF